MNNPTHVDIMRTNPREGLQLFLFIATFIWQSPIAVVGLLTYLFLVRVLDCSWQLLLSLAISSACLRFIFDNYLSHNQLTILDLALNGFAVNFQFWKTSIYEGMMHTSYYYAINAANPLMSFSLVFAFLYKLIDLIAMNPHQATMHALQQGKKIVNNTVTEATIQKELTKMNKQVDLTTEGTHIGISLLSGNPVVIPDKDLNQVMLVLGTTGSGKTITLRRFYQRAMIKGYPLCIVNGKPTQEDIEWLMKLAEEYKRPFYGFNGGNNAHYNSLSHGSHTELKDKIICLKDEWENEYYRTIAEDYLQTAFSILQKANKKISLSLLAECLSFKKLAAIAYDLKDSIIKQHIKRLREYNKQDINGLRAHLNLLIYSELGPYFEEGENWFSLNEVFQNQGVVHFALPALKYPSFSSVLGKSVINDIKTTIESHSDKQKVFTVFDEFSIFAGVQSLNLVNMGRGKGVHAIFGTQGLGELDQVDTTFKQQLLNCVNTIICHRVNDHDSAEAIATWIGTTDTYSLTAQINKYHNDAAMGTVRQTREFIIHPDDIKQTLNTGEAFYATKLGFKRDKVKIKYSE